MRLPLNLENANYQQLKDALFRGVISNEQLVKAYIARIHEIDHELHSILEINPNAVQEARDVDSLRASGKTIGPLAGLPILIKDLIAVLPPLSCTGGSSVLLGTQPAKEAPIVSQLQNSGAIILGMTNMSEFGVSRHAGAPFDRWSARGGQMWSRYYNHASPQGSSGGSAIAVDAGFAFAALGTQTFGSIVKPAGRNNVVGVRPTSGLLPTEGLIDNALTGTAGVLARTVADAFVVLSNCMTSKQPSAIEPHWDEVNLSRFKIGVPDTYLQLPLAQVDYWSAEKGSMFVNEAEKQHEDAACGHALQVLISLGARIERDVEFRASRKQIRSVLDDAMPVILTDLRDSLTKWCQDLAVNPNGIDSFSAIVKASKEIAAEDWPARGLDIFEKALTAGSSNSPEYVQAKEHCRWLGTEGTVIGALDKYHLDALAMPAYAGFALAEIAGLPQIVVPCGFYPDDAESTPLVDTPGAYNTGPGMPIGICFVGRAHSENKLFAIAHAYEQATQWRSKGKPLFKATTQPHVPKV